MNNNTGPIWVKASERLPEDEHLVHIKWRKGEDKQFATTALFDGKYWSEQDGTVITLSHDQVEWLDENAPAPSLVDMELLEMVFNAGREIIHTDDFMYDDFEDYRKRGGYNFSRSSMAGSNAPEFPGIDETVDNIIEHIFTWPTETERYKRLAKKEIIALFRKVIGLGEGTTIPAKPQLFIHDTIDGSMEEIESTSDAVKYVLDNYAENGGIHIDLSSFSVYARLGAVVSLGDDETCTGVEYKAIKLPIIDVEAMALKAYPDQDALSIHRREVFAAGIRAALDKT